MRHALLFGLLATGLVEGLVSCVGTDAAGPAPRPAADEKDAWRRIFGSVAVESRAYADLAYLCDRIGGRMSGQESGRRAEEYGLRKFKDYGLQEVHFEPFTMLAWRRGPLSVEVTAPLAKKLDAYSLGNTPSGEVEGELVDLGYGTPTEFRRAGDAVRGKVALVMNGAPEGHRRVHRSEKMSLCQEHGAIAMLFANDLPGTIVQVGTAQTGRIAKIPGVALPKEQGEWLRRLSGAERTAVRIHAQASHGDAEVRNVVGEIRGKGDDLVLVGAHLDSWDLAQGAIDNGVGAAIVLETARLLASLGQKPARTIRFVLFMGEEFGLFGSKAYVRAHAGELDKVVMMLNLDMVGKPYGYELYACDEAIPFFQALAGQLSHAGMGKSVTSKADLYSDQQPFMLAGVPAMSLRNRLDPEMSRYYHSAGDTLDKANEEYLNQAAALTAVTLWELAGAKERPAPRLPPEVVRERMIRDGVREALELNGEWPWK